MLKRILLGAAMAAATATAAQAITVDGIVTAGEYAGAITTFIPYDPTSPTDFSSYPPSSELTAYTVYYTADQTNVYVGLITNPAGAGLDKHNDSLGLVFANLYFDTAPGTGSDIGFEVFNDRSFTPGVNIGTHYGPISGQGASFAKTVGTTYANGGAPSMIEFAMSWDYFLDDPDNLFPNVAPGGGLQLRLSQSFGYAPARPVGEPFFGVVTAPVPEPATWAMLVAGFMGAGVAVRRRRVAAA
jgi:hypothetical protein